MGGQEKKKRSGENDITNLIKIVKKEWIIDMFNTDHLGVLRPSEMGNLKVCLSRDST